MIILLRSEFPILKAPMSNNFKQELFQLMQDISEDGYHARWMSGSHEHKLWDAVLNGPVSYGQTKITNEKIVLLKDLSSRAGGWWIFNEEKRDFEFMKLQAWKKYFSPELARYSLSEIIEDTRSLYTAKRTYFIYNQRCPICRITMASLRNNRTRPKEIVLIDVSMQKDNPIYALVNSRRDLLRNGPIIYRKMKIHHKASVVNYVFEQPSNGSIFSLSKKMGFLISYFLHQWVPWVHPKDPDSYRPSSRS